MQQSPLPGLRAVICTADAMHWKGHLRGVWWQPAACSSVARVLSRLALCSHVLSDSHQVKNRKEWQWATKEKRQVGIRPPRGETFERWPRLTSNPPAVGSCDALASWDVRSQSAAAPAPAAAPGYSWDQNKTVQQLKAQPVFMKSGLNTDSLSFFFLLFGKLERLQTALDQPPGLL